MRVKILGLFFIVFRMNWYLLSFFLIIIFNNCTKKSECSGRVYSKNNIPIPNASVIVCESSSPSDCKDISTDKTYSSGDYHISFKTKNNNSYWIRCECDSGVALGVLINNSKSNSVDLYVK